MTSLHNIISGAQGLLMLHDGIKIIFDKDDQATKHCDANYMQLLNCLLTIQSILFQFKNFSKH